jgi:two-component system cell cycle response regulator DivK
MSHPPSAAGFRILLVDDYADAIEMWGLYLRLQGYDVLTSGDGLGAVESAVSGHPDLVVLDLDLPGVSGLEAARRLRQFPGTSAIPLIAVTGHSNAGKIEEARLAGFDSVLIKPCEPAALLEELERVLQKAKPDFVPPKKNIA